MVCVLQTIVYKSQIANYITNGGFENLHNCIGFDQSINIAKGWRTLDSINFGGVISNICLSNVPNGTFAYQWPKTGQSYGLTDFLCQPPQCNPSVNRGYFRNRLKANLINGKTYCVKLYVNVGNYSSSNGISNVGVFFVDNSVDTITKISIPLTYINPQVENPTTNIIIDTMNWVPITGTFVANGTEKNCVIGNFRSDAATTKTLINNSILPAITCCILIDDVSCIPLDLPAFAGADAWAIPGTTIYIGRPQDVGIDEACKWYNLTNTVTTIANAAGFSLTVSATTTTYMVKQDICGVIKYDTVVVHPSALGNVEWQMLNDKLKLYPNPTNEVLNVEVEMLNAKLEIINALGQMIREEEITFKENKTTISTKELANGVYVLTLLDTASPTRSDKKQSVSKRFVVAR